MTFREMFREPMTLQGLTCLCVGIIAGMAMMGAMCLFLVWNMVPLGGCP